MANFKYDVCLSFAAGDREYVESVAAELRNRGVAVFNNRHGDGEMDLWGKDLSDHLLRVYRDEARYCVIFVSRSYAASPWASLELRSAQERAVRQSDAYILPVRLDHTDLPGLSSATGYIDAATSTPVQVAKLIVAKVQRAISPETSAPEWTAGTLVSRQRVFISYAREDGVFARRLGKDLGEIGLDVWMDQTHMRGGQLWDDTVEQALASSAVVVVVLTPAGVASPSVRDEVAYALDENKIVAPALYQKCRIPLRLRRLHYSDFTLDYTNGFEELRRALMSSTS